MIHPKNPDGSPMTIREQLARAAGRKAKRTAKGLDLGLRKPRKAAKSIARLSGRKSIKDAIVRLLGLLDMKRNGKWCRYASYCPAFRRLGPHAGDTACHVVPQMRGDSSRFFPANVIWGCRAANYGEVMNRSLYRDIHVQLFGREYVERIEELARKTRKYTTAELVDLRNDLRKQISTASPKATAGRNGAGSSS